MWLLYLALLPVVLGDACLEGQWACGLVWFSVNWRRLLSKYISRSEYLVGDGYWNVRDCECHPV